MTENLSDTAYEDNIKDLQNYKRIRKLRFKRSEYDVFQLQYEHTIHYFVIHSKTKSTYFINSDTGVTNDTKQLQSLRTKILAYDRVTSNIIDGIEINNFLSIDYIDYILEEFAIPSKKMRNRLYSILRDIPMEKNSREFLTLLDFIGNMEYIQDLMTFHLGQPEVSENYVRKLDNLIQRLKDAIDIKQAPAVFDDNIDMVRLMLKYFSDRDLRNIIMVGNKNWFVLKAGSDFMETTNLPVYSNNLDLLDKINDFKQTIICFLNYELVNRLYKESTVLQSLSLMH